MGIVPKSLNTARKAPSESEGQRTIPPSYTPWAQRRASGLDAVCWGKLYAGASAENSGNPREELKRNPGQSGGGTKPGEGRGGAAVPLNTSPKQQEREHQSRETPVPFSKFKKRDFLWNKRHRTPGKSHGTMLQKDVLKGKATLRGTKVLPKDRPTSNRKPAPTLQPRAWRPEMNKIPPLLQRGGCHVLYAGDTRNREGGSLVMSREGPCLVQRPDAGSGLLGCSVGSGDPFFNKESLPPAETGEHEDRCTVP